MQGQLRREDMDFIDERRWQAAIRNAQYNQALSATTNDSCIVGSSGSGT
jgi:hypothetical protein